ncbi:putative Thioesterase [Candidatus Desulfarcum epimagneticum]|uniref:Putative Thioesterase n=1 Tax=uncultured Desulfobacteraceae bacterium TaxID=218296 RepID=A0A484HE48_9BACT|nr:putative Thioesterase [uncultured Desulfobacteraceae bacterium]
MLMTPEELKPLVETSLKFLKRAGLKVLDIRPRYVKLEMPLKNNENHIGIMYAGALFTISEVPGGALSYATFDAEKFFPVVKDMSIRFIKPAKTDVTIEISISEEEAARIEKEATETGKSEFVLEGEIRDASGEAVAAARGVYQLRKV